MKKYLLFLLAVTFIISSCNKEEDYLNGFDDQDDQWGEYDDLNDLEDDYDDDHGGQGDEGDAIEGGLTLYKVDDNIITKIKDYSVSTNLQKCQDDVNTHFEMWDFVTRLIPLNYRDKIVEFEVFHGGGDLLGYVLPPTENDLSKWRFGLAIDAIEGGLDDIDFTNLFTYVAIHEYGHVLTLNDDQVDASGGACNTYFTGEGCSNENSYINKLYNLGWADIANDPDVNDPFELYEKYEDRFVSNYAATNPGEDIAEVFSFFVTMQDRPTGNKIKDQKINLLYTFPKLVKLRDDIRASGGPVLNLRPGSWMQNPLANKFKLCNRKGCNHHKQSRAK